MAKAIECKPNKLAAIVRHFQKSKVCWNIKDLEKQLPSVASINGMQVKDYLQALQDESMICVEKIGSGNWYWSFVSTDKNKRSKALAEARSANTKVLDTVTDLRSKVAAKVSATDDDDEHIREELTVKHAGLESELKVLKKELEAYSDNDPEELERKETEIGKMRAEIEQYTDDIWSMEGWFKKNGMEAAVNALRMVFYGDEWDREECDFIEV